MANFITYEQLFNAILSRCTKERTNFGSGEGWKEFIFDKEKFELLICEVGLSDMPLDRIIFMQTYRELEVKLDLAEKNIVHNYKEIWPGVWRKRNAD